MDKKWLHGYIKRGFYIFPLSATSKRPVFNDMLNRASNNPVEILEWEKKYKNCNWGLSLAKSGLVCVDIDHKHGGMDAWLTTIESKGEPETLKQVTGTGGFHYVFLATNEKYKGKIQSGIDIKHNGYIVIEPSQNPKTKSPYKWVDWEHQINEAPDWLKLLIEREAVAPRKQSNYRFGRTYLDECVKLLRTTDLGYEEWVNAGMAIHAAEPNEKGLELYLQLTEGKSYQPGDEEKAAAKWNSFTSHGGVSPLTLGYIIRSKSLSPPNPYYAEDVEAFKKAQIEDLEKKKAIEGFTSINGKLANYNRHDIIEWFNMEGYAMLTTGTNSPFLKTTEKKDGSLDFFSMSEKALREITAPYFFVQVVESKEKWKEVFTPAYREWLESTQRKTYKKIVFREKTGPNELNLYKPITPYDPIEGEPPKEFIDLIHNSLCNGNIEKSEWLLDWLAHLIQKPFERASTVPVHITKQGAGKGLLYDAIMKSLLNGYYTAITTASELMARFNMNLTNKFLTYIDEATWRGNKTEDGILKRLTGSPTISVEEKFGARFEIDNYSRYVIASNNKEAVALEIGNRRYVVIEGNDKTANNLSYFAPIIAKIKDREAMGKFYNFLLTRDIESFNPHMALENNYDGAQAKIASMGPIAKFWDDIFSEEAKPFWVKGKGLYRKVVFDAFLSYADSIKSYEKSISARKFWQVTGELCPALPKKKLARIGDGKKYCKVMDINPVKFAKCFYETTKIKQSDDFNEQWAEPFYMVTDFEEEDEFEI